MLDIYGLAALHGRIGEGKGRADDEEVRSDRHGGAASLRCLLGRAGQRWLAVMADKSGSGGHAGPEPYRQLPSRHIAMRPTR